MRAIVILGALIASVTALADEHAGESPPKHFSHAMHRKHGVDTSKCTSCHAVQGDVVQAPAGKAHTPCLTAGCHGGEPGPKRPISFFAISAKYANDPKTRDLYRDARALCLGCHEQVPEPWQTTPIRAHPSRKPDREFHVEMAREPSPTDDRMTHYQHTKKLNGCLSCHKVDNDASNGRQPTWQRVEGKPGHAECVMCHHQVPGTPNPKHFAMDACTRCHVDGARANSHAASDVNICKQPHQRHCFAHEHEGHRKNQGKDLQCADCHAVVAAEDRTKWGSNRFETIADLHRYKLVGAPTTRSCGKQHEACTKDCHVHQAQVFVGSNQCSVCHAVIAARICTF